MSQRESEPVFCSECQNEVDVSAARVLNGHVLCPADLGRRSMWERLRARKLPENEMRRGGGALRSFFLSLAALMLVVGVAFIWKDEARVTGVCTILASVFVGFFGVLAGDIVDVLLDIFDQLRQLNRR